MKTYEQMTDSVMEKVRVCRAARQKRNRRIGITLVTCLSCFVLMFAAFNWLQPEPQPKTHTTVPDSPRIIFLSANASGSHKQVMIKNVVTPYQGVLRVKDLRKLPEEEHPEVLLSERNAVRQQLHPEVNDTSLTQFGGYTTIITLGFDGRFYLTVSDFSQIEDMSVRTTENGVATISPQGFKTVTSDMIEAARSATGLGIWWSLSDSMVQKLEKDPTMDLTQIKDTVTVTVKFKDGTTDEAAIDVTVGEDGKIYYCYQGTEQLM